LIDEHGVDLSAGKLRDGAKRKRGKVVPVEAKSPAVGGDPKVAIRRLGNFRNTVVGEAVFGLPGPVKPSWGAVIFPEKREQETDQDDERAWKHLKGWDVNRRRSKPNLEF
jgi:hypothetical protein